MFVVNFHSLYACQKNLLFLVEGKYRRCFCHTNGSWKWLTLTYKTRAYALGWSFFVNLVFCLLLSINKTFVSLVPRRDKELWMGLRRLWPHGSCMSSSQRGGWPSQTASNVAWRKVLDLWISLRNVPIKSASQLKGLSIRASRWCFILQLVPQTGSHATIERWEWFLVLLEADQMISSIHYWHLRNELTYQ